MIDYSCMVDLVPEDYSPLLSAFDRFCQVLWNGGSPIADLSERILNSGLPEAVTAKQIAALGEVSDRQLSEFVLPFAKGELEALVRRQGSPENYAIPSEEWANAFFPERLFLNSEVARGHGDYWDALQGRTPFVRREQLAAWLSRFSSQIKRSGRRGIPPIEALRQCLIGLVMDGVLDATDAEAMAANWGLAPFATKPSLLEFDPMAESSWTLAMTIA